jgi:hypothetical protein
MTTTSNSAKPGRLKAAVLTIALLLKTSQAGVCHGETPNAAWVGKDNTGGTACTTGYYNEGCEDTPGSGVSKC